MDLHRARTLDRILSAEESTEDPALRNLLRQRNHSILAHGFEPVGEKAARGFLDYVDAMVREPEARVLAEHVRLREL